MATPGMLHEDIDVKLLVLYVLKRAKMPITFNEIIEIVRYYEVVDYFQFCEALDFMLISGHVALNPSPRGEVYSITPQGLDTYTTLKKRFPIYAKDKIYAASLKVLARIKYEEQIKTDIKTIESGYIASCTICDNETNLVNMEFFAPDKYSAYLITKNFKSNPENLYKKLLTMLTDETLKSEK